MHPIYASLEAADIGNDYLTFLQKLAEEIVKYARQAIDSPEERKALEDGVMAYYDKYFTPFVPFFLRAVMRRSVHDALDAALVAAAGITPAGAQQ